MPDEEPKPGDLVQISGVNQVNPETAMPEPESVIACRKALAKMSDMVDAGEVESISAYVEMRDGTSYRTFQTTAPGRLEDAGKLLELAMMRLGFVDKFDVEQMIQKALEGE